MRNASSLTLAVSSLAITTGTAVAQPAVVDPYGSVPHTPPKAALAYVDDVDDDVVVEETVAPHEAAPRKQLLHGFRIGYGVIMNYDEPTRENEMSLKDELGLKSAHSMLLGYEAFYRVIGQDWLNVVLVGNVTVAGLEQSKFIPTASGLIGAEINESFQLGVGVNLVPDAQAPTHMIAAAGWTPRAGKIQTPVHFFFVPDAAGNHRTGVTVGVTW